MICVYSVPMSAYSAQLLINLSMMAETSRLSSVTSFLSVASAIFCHSADLQHHRNPSRVRCSGMCYVITFTLSGRLVHYALDFCMSLYLSDLTVHLHMYLP